jgi:hypothetical protein
MRMITVTFALTGIAVPVISWYLELPAYLFIIPIFDIMSISISFKKQSKYKLDFNKQAATC